MTTAQITAQQFSRTLVQLPPAQLQYWEWQGRALCRSHDTSVFYYDGERSDRSASVREAKSICQGCPVVLQCLDHALRTREPHGVWGGLTPTERSRHIIAMSTADN